MTLLFDFISKKRLATGCVLLAPPDKDTLRCSCRQDYTCASRPANKPDTSWAGGGGAASNVLTERSCFLSWTCVSRRPLTIDCDLLDVVLFLYRQDPEHIW